MWKEIQGFEGYYEVSDSGEVKGLDRVVYDTKGRYTGKPHIVKGRLMKLTESVTRPQEQGYLVVNLRRDSKANVIPVHLLVAKAFIPNPNNLPTVNHIDGNKHNNNVSNLEWATYSENNTHALRTGLRKPRGTPTAQYSLSGEFIACFPSESEAARATGLSRAAISHCLHGRTRQSQGYVWKIQSESATTIPQGSTQEDELPAEVQRPLDERKI